MNNPYQHLKEYEGKEFKYKEELCPLLNIEYKVGKAKDLQLNQLKQYMDIEKINRKIRINKIYEDSEIEIIENRGKYLTHIENYLMILLSKYAKMNHEYVILTNRDILELTMMVNKNYFKGMWKIFNYIDCFNLPINEQDIPEDNKEGYILDVIFSQSRIFFSATYRLFKRIIYDCLTSMEKRSLILKNKTFVCYKNYKENKKWYSITYECDDDMIKRILSVQYRAVKEYDEILKEKTEGRKFLKDIDSTYILNFEEKKEFKSILNSIFQEEFQKEGFTTYSKAWKLNLNESIVFEKELSSRIFNGKQLNNNVINKLMQAKDLEALNEALKEQFIRKFITKNTLSKEMDISWQIKAKPYIKQE